MGLIGVAVSIGWTLALILADEKGEAFEGLLVVDNYSLFFNFLFAGVAAAIILASVDLLERNRYQAEYFALVLRRLSG